MTAQPPHAVALPVTDKNRLAAQGSPAVPDPVNRFHSEHPSLVAELPHRNPQNGACILALKVSCDDCDCVLPLETLHGVINDYAHCTEVRYVAHCPRCGRVVHNVLRLTGEEMRFIKDGKWCVATRRPWWQRLWPWPVDREWS